MKKYFLLFSIVCFIGLSFGQSLPEFQIKNTKNGNVTRDSILKSKKVTVINFWASWCAPCKEEMLEINRLKTQNEFKDIQFVSISIDKKENVESAKAWFLKHKLTWKLYLDTDQSLFSKILSLTNNTSSSIPVCIVVNSNGELVSFHQGFDQAKYRDELLEDIKSIKE